MDITPKESSLSSRSTAPVTGLDRVEGALRATLEIVVAALVAAEVVILLAGVFARYVMHTPLVWADELASILFLWLAMLGAAVAFQRREHMRMTAALS